jgi:hypothetical protein
MVPITVLDIILHSVLYLKHTMDNVRTSLETHYFSATSSTGAIYTLVTMAYRYNCHNSGHYPSSCLLFKTRYG